MKTTVFKPNQRVSKKTKLTAKFAKDNVDYYGGISNLSGEMKKEMRSLYNLATGYFNESDYSYVKFPYGEEQRKREELQGDPARIRNYDIITPAVNVYLGEKASMDFQPQVVAVNTDIDDKRVAYIKDKIKESLIAAYHEELRNNGIEPDVNVPSNNVDKIMQEANEIPDTKSTMAQHALDYLKNFNELERKYRLGFFDYISVGRVFTYRGILANDTDFEIVNPLDFDYNCSQETEFVEDGESAWCEYRMSYTDVLDQLQDKLEESDIKRLKDLYGTNYAGVNELVDRAISDVDDGWVHASNDFTEKILGRKNEIQNGILVKHVVWKSEVKLGKLYVYDEAGNEIDFIEVDEDFKPREGEDIEWIWATEVWEAYQISDDIYTKASPVLTSRANINNPYKCKLPYNGRTYGYRTSLPNTPVKIGKSYQQLYNVIKYRMERTIAKNKDKFTVLPLGMIAEGKGQDMFSTMYYTDYHGYMFVDETAPGFTTAMQALKSIDGSMSQYIQYINNICREIKEEFEDIVGITQVRKGQSNASDQVGVTRQAFQQSLIRSEDIYRGFEELEERDCQQLLELSKYAWIKGKRAAYFNEDRDIVNFTIDPAEYSMINFGVFVKFNKEEKRKLEEFKANAQAFAQNGAAPSIVGKIIKSNNINTVMKELDKLEKQIAESTRASQESEQAVEGQKNELEYTKHKEELEFDYYKVDTESQLKREQIYAQREASVISAINGSGGQVDIATLNKIQADIEKSQVAREKVQADREASRDKVKISNNQLKIAKENKNKHDV